MYSGNKIKIQKSIHPLITSHTFVFLFFYIFFLEGGGEVTPFYSYVIACYIKVILSAPLVASQLLKLLFSS